MSTQNRPQLFLEPIEQNTATEMVANRLVRLLANGDLKPGDKLPPERELAHQLRVGRTTVREALKLLTLSGLLEARRGDGTYVNREFTNLISKQIEWPVLLSVHELDMIVEVREALELKAARLAAERATAEEIERIAVYQLLISLKERDYQLETDLDLQFHDAIALASHNPLLASLMVSLREILRKYIYSSNEKTESIQTTITEHETIFKAIASRNPDAAEKAMQDHLAISKAEILKAIDQISQESMK
jgi:GntR family transcriptional regulator, transcriptional repressor for pyruvate dehydrogenase complex